MALAQMLTGVLIAYAVAGIFVSAEYFSYLYFTLALSVGLIKLVRMRAKSSPAVVPRINVRIAPRTPPAEQDLAWVRKSVESSFQGPPARR